MHAHMQGKYNPRQSVSFPGVEHPFGSPFQYPQQNSPTVWSPQQMLYQQGHLGHSRGGSPSVSLQNLGAIVSPASPFSQDGYFPQNGDVLVQMQQRQHILQNQLAHQQQLQLQGGARASPRLQEVREIPEEEVPSKSPSKTPEARQSRHNPSNSLQQEIDDAEYHLEEQMQRELEHEDYSPHSDKEENQFAEEPTPGHSRNISSLHQALNGLGASRYAEDSEDGPVLHHPQPHSRGHSLSQRPFQDSEESATESKSGLLRIADPSKADLSDIETNPSNLGTPIQGNDLSGSGHGRSLSVASNPWADSGANRAEDSNAPRRGHIPKPSMSKLNVAAKEFKFDPSSSFSKPSLISFNGNNFQNPVPFGSFAPPVSATSSHFSHHSVSGSRSHINVAAPVFTPGRSEFSFSASGPSFRPDAPAFTPLKATFSDSVGSGSDGPRTASIFGNIDLSGIGISKPSKKSKAVPIVRPDSSHSRNLDDEVMEGKDGRITQGEGRFKRARGAKEDGDSVPLFAEPSMPLGETTREQSPPKENLVVVTTQADKENSAPLEEDAEERVQEVPIKSQAGNFPDSSPEHGKDFVPYEFNEQKQAEDFNAARPFTSRRYGSGLPAYGTFIPSASEDEVKATAEPQKSKGHRKSGSSLSATAKPFEFKPGAFSFKFGQLSEPAPAVVSPPLPSASLPSAGLSASKYARSPSPPGEVLSPELEMNSHESAQFQDSLPGPDSAPTYAEDKDFEDREPTFEEIDAVMRQLNEVELESAAVDTPRWTQPSSPPRQIHMPDPDNSSPTRLQPQNVMRSDAPSPSPGRFQALPGHSNVFGRVHEDPFTNQPRFDSPVHLNTLDSLPPSEWDDVLSETEEAKLQPRAQFFDNHVNDLVGGLLAHRLEPLERTLETIQMSIDMMAARAPSSRRERRSISGALSDADDEDDDNEFPRRSLSPRRDKKLEKIRSIINEALTTHQASRPQTATIAPEQSTLPDTRSILGALEEMKEQFGQSMRLDLRGEDLRNIVEEAVEKRLPSTPKPVIDEAAVAREAEYKAKIAELEERLLRADSDGTKRHADLEDRLHDADNTVEEEIKSRRAAEDRLAEVQRLLRISSEEEIRLREVVEEKELKIRQVEVESAQKVKTHQAVEDRLAEVQRMLRISSEEENRLRQATDERELKIRRVEDEIAQKSRIAEEQRAKTTMRIALLEAAQENAQRTQSELHNRLNITENELRESRQEVQRWQMEAERALEAARRHSEDAEQANETNKDLRRRIESLRTQMEESIRVREGFRGKLMDLQEDMAAAAREITEENARRAKKEQELIARQEVLDARLQAEARTRERLETEIERLEAGEREGMRAVSDIKKMEVLLTELRTESQNAQKDAMRYQREFEEARESGLSEVQRTRHYMQAEIEAANNQVNVVREDLENQILRLRAEIDNVKLEADTARAKSEMLLEEAETSKSSLLADFKVKHADELEDLQTRHERQLNVALEDAQRAEQHLLERLSLSAAKTEHLQDRVSHLEEKLEIASQAAAAAAAAAKTARSLSSSSPTAVKPLGRAMELPEKISPQALRESIMVLQEQLQNRESTIEELEATLSTVDVEAPTKIQKCEDEIMWLRELLSVRKSDLQDIVTALQGGEYDPDRVRDAAIRLRANLQMEEQERERAMNGGSSLTLPNIASSLRDVAGGVAASPRVAQAVGPLAAAWGNWRKGRADSAVAQAQQPLHARSSSSTPNRNASSSPSNSSFLSGLLTPPASNSNLRSASSLSRAQSNEPQPTAFGSTGQRLTAAQLASRPRGMSKQSLVGPRGSPAKSAVPSTPPMMRKSSYDADAREGVEDFSDAGFYDDDESTVEDGPAGLAAAMYGPGPTVGGKQVGSW